MINSKMDIVVNSKKKAKNVSIVVGFGKFRILSQNWQLHENLVFFEFFQLSENNRERPNIFHQA